MNNDAFVGFRADDWPLFEDFIRGSIECDVTKTDLAKKAIEMGLKPALEFFENAKEEEKARKKRVRKLLSSQPKLCQEDLIHAFA